MSFEEWVFDKLRVGMFERGLGISNTVEKIDLYKISELVNINCKDCLDVIRKYTLMEVIERKGSTEKAIEKYLNKLGQHTPTILFFREFAYVDSSIKIEVYHN